MPEQTTREQILQVAHDAFTRKGFANSSVSEICTEAGVSAPTLYYHFGNKDGLFQAVVEETLSLDAFNNLLQEAIAPAGDVWSKLHAYVYTYLCHFPTQLLNPGLHLQDSTQLNGKSLQQLEAGLSQIYQLTNDLLQEGITSGELRQVDVHIIASCLMGTVDSFVRSQVYLGVQYDPQELTSAIVDLFANGLSPS